MGYVKAETILPDNLLREIQKYIQGEYVYIPSEHTTRKKWGKSQVPGSVYKIEMKLYVISMKVDIPFTRCQKNFFFP
ncbi:MAG TPA: hypothetical protein DIT16_04170 [Clostridium sp.]|nr:hypothetical protein [Clostridium sp.]